MSTAGPVITRVEVDEFAEEGEEEPMFCLFNCTGMFSMREPRPSPKGVEERSLEAKDGKA